MSVQSQAMVLFIACVYLLTGCTTVSLACFVYTRGGPSEVRRGVRNAFYLSISMLAAVRGVYFMLDGLTDAGFSSFPWALRDALDLLPHFFYLSTWHLLAYFWASIHSQSLPAAERKLDFDPKLIPMPLVGFNIIMYGFAFTLVGLLFFTDQESADTLVQIIQTVAASLSALSMLVAAAIFGRHILAELLRLQVFNPRGVRGDDALVILSRIALVTTVLFAFRTAVTFWDAYDEIESRDSALPFYFFLTEWVSVILILSILRRPFRRRSRQAPVSVPGSPPAPASSVVSPTVRNYLAINADEVSALLNPAAS